MYYWGIENVDGSLPNEKKKDFYMNDFESDRDYYRKLYNNKNKPFRTNYIRPRANLYFGAPVARKPTCKPGYKLIVVDGKYKCRKYLPKSKYPWKVFPQWKTGGLFGFGNAISKVGNFIFMIIIIAGAVYFGPKIIRAGTEIANSFIGTYGKWKQVKSIPTKQALGISEEE